MRFLLFDRVVLVEPRKRLTAVKLFNLMDGSSGNHYPRRPVLPASLVVEALAQVGGMLNLLNHDFAVDMVLMMVEGARMPHQAQQGDVLTLEVTMLYDHTYGATMTGTARVGELTVATVDRIFYAHEQVTSEEVVERNRRRYQYQSGALAVPHGGES
jgi:3-hydroxyacyl-[acyl-carrier-protein] dehydratase